MRQLFILLWLLLPIGAWAYHQGPGQQRLDLDHADASLRVARSLAEEKRWAEADAAFETALGLLPEEGNVNHARRIRLERAKVQMFAKKLPEANADLEALVDQMQADTTAEPQLLDEARAALANSQYYVTWLMRLEGLPRADWEPEIEASRQTFALLAQNSKASGDEQAALRHQEDLESSIRLARMDLKDLQGLPLPSHCQGCCSCKGPGRGQQGKKPSSGEKKPEDSRGASSGPPPDNSGS